MSRKTKPRRWGRWQKIDEPPKEGGQGIVYFVKDATAQLVGIFALKELKNARRLYRFEREIRAISLLQDHGHIIRIVDHEVFTSGEAKPYFVMERAEGSLAERIDDLRDRWERIFRVFEQVVDAARCLHSRGIIHRDIKPANVLFVGEVPKLSDFGLCLISGAVRRTPQSEAVGSRYYMAPELEDGAQPNITPAADVYSLGKLLYYLLSGGRVFAREKHDMREHRLSALLNDPRMLAFDKFFSETIVESPGDRLKDAGQVLVRCEEAVRQFWAHPLSRLLKRFPDPLSAIGAAPGKVCRACPPEEIEELLKMVETRNEPPTTIFLIEVAKKLNAQSLTRYLTLLSRVRAEPRRKDLRVISRNLRRSPAVVREMFHSMRQWGHVGERLVAEIIRHSTQSALAELCKSVAFVLRHSPQNAALLAQRLRSAGQLTRKSRETVLLELAQCDFPGKFRFFREEWTRSNLSRVGRQTVLAGIGSVKGPAPIQALSRILKRASVRDDVGDFVAGVSFTREGRDKLVQLSKEMVLDNQGLHRLFVTGVEILEGAERRTE